MSELVQASELDPAEIGLVQLVSEEPEFVQHLPVALAPVGLVSALAVNWPLVLGAAPGHEPVQHQLAVQASAEGCELAAASAAANPASPPATLGLAQDVDQGAGPGLA